VAEACPSRSVQLRRQVSAVGAGAALCALLVLSGACSRISPLRELGQPAASTATASSVAAQPRSHEPWSIVPTQPPADAKLRDIAPEVDRLAEADSLQIVRKWSGFAVIGRRVEQYQLTRQGDQFTGSGLIQAFPGRALVKEREASQPVAVPADVLRGLLQRLADISTVKGSYKPRDEWTDDHPETQATVTLPNGQAVRYFSQSQGTLQVPWSVTAGGTTYIVHGTAVARVLEELEPYLLQSTLRDLAKDMEREDSMLWQQRAAGSQRATREAVQSPTSSPSPASR
jgi:hypothetical protein